MANICSNFTQVSWNSLLPFNATFKQKLQENVTNINLFLSNEPGRAIAEAFSRWPPTAAARVQSRVWSSGICGGQSGVGAGFLRVLRFPPAIHSTEFSIHTITRGRYIRPVSGRRAEWTQFGPHPPLCKLKKNLSNEPITKQLISWIIKNWHGSYLFK
jgi:hypothetical protein